MIIKIVITVLAGAVLSIFQSTIFMQIVPIGFIPDLALLMLIAFSWNYGPVVGVIAGFLVGLSNDLLSLAPLGFHAFIYTLSGYLFGRLNENFSPRGIFLPVLAASAATLVKYGSASLLDIVFALKLGSINALNLNALWEALLNNLFAPLVFFVASQVTKLTNARRGGF